MFSPMFSPMFSRILPILVTLTILGVPEVSAKDDADQPYYEFRTEQQFQPGDPGVNSLDAFRALAELLRITNLNDAVLATCPSVKPAHPDLGISAAEALDALRLDQLREHIFGNLLSRSQKLAYRYLIERMKAASQKTTDQIQWEKTALAFKFGLKNLREAAHKNLRAVLREISEKVPPYQYEVEEVPENYQQPERAMLIIKITFPEPAIADRRLKKLGPLVIYIPGNIDGSKVSPREFEVSQYFVEPADPTTPKSGAIQNAVSLREFFDGENNATDFCEEVRHLQDSGDPGLETPDVRSLTPTHGNVSDGLQKNLPEFTNPPFQTPRLVPRESGSAH